MNNALFALLMIVSTHVLALSPAEVFSTIPYKQGEVTDPKAKTFLISGCVNPEKGQTAVGLIDIDWVGSAKVKKTISTTYTVK